MEDMGPLGSSLSKAMSILESAALRYKPRPLKENLKQGWAFSEGRGNSKADGERKDAGKDEI